MAFEILLIIILVLLNGFFVAAEFAIVKVRHSQIEVFAQKGSSSAKIAEHILEHLNAYLSATQLGITLASLALGWFGEETMTKLIMMGVHSLGLSLSDETAHQIALPTAFVMVTFMHIIFGEIAPKSIAIQFPMKSTLFISVPLNLFYKLFSPFIWLLNECANLVLRSIGIQPIEKHTEEHSIDEIKLLLAQGAESGALKSSDHELIENVFTFNTTLVKQILVPRTKVMAIEVSAPDEEIIKKVISDGYSRMPVYRETIDDIVGIVHTKDLLRIVQDKETIILKDIMRAAYFIPDTKKISSLLKDFQKKRVHMAVVLDEFGGTSGIVTMEDVIEEIVGEIQDEYDEEKPIFEKINEKQFIALGIAPLSDLNEHLPHPLPEADDFDTLSGYMNFIFGKIPEENEVRSHGGYEFTILKRNNNVVESIKIVELLKDDD